MYDVVKLNKERMTKCLIYLCVSFRHKVHVTLLRK